MQTTPQINYQPKIQWTLTVTCGAAWLLVSLAVRHLVVHPLQTITNLLSGLREGDFSVRACGGRPNDALGDLINEVNALSEMLREQRLGAMEATALLRTVM